MSKLSLNAVDQMYRSYSEDPALMLFTVSFPNNNIFYYVNNTEDVTSNGQLYTAFPFKFSLPDDTNEEVPELVITMSNIGLDLVSDLNENTDNINANIDIVFASFPDFVELSVKNMILRRVSYDAKFITMTFGYDDILNVQIPSFTYSAKDYPGLLNV